MSPLPLAPLEAAPDAPAVALTPPAYAAATPGDAMQPDTAGGADCRNCGARLHGPFCAQCGQRVPLGNPTIHDVVHDATHELLHVDGRLMHTLRDLLLQPGRLTREFLDGRRARYVSPLRLYLTCSVLFFFIASAAPTSGDVGLATVSEDTPAGRVQRPLNAAERDSLSLMLERKATRVGGILGAGMRGVARAEREPERAQRAMIAAMPKIMFVLVPFFALVTMLVYRRRGLHYPSHLYFALHVFAFYFLVSAVTRLARFAHVPEAATLASMLAVLVTIGYLAVAMRRVYGGRRWSTALRLASLVAVFGTGFLVVILASAVLVLGFAAG